MEKPDLTGVAPAVTAYIEYLEKELGHSRTRHSATVRSEREAEEEDPSLPPLDATEPPTTLQIITVSRGGLAKRTARHLYERQRRGGMGIFDIDLPDDDTPITLCHADERDMLLLITNKARAFRLRADEIASGPVRSKGHRLPQLHDDEYPAALLPNPHGLTLVLVSEKGYARALPAHVVGMGMTPGVSLYRYAEFGPVAAACWSGGKGDLLLATRNGLGIRFAERALAVPGGLGIRLENGDKAVGVAAVQPPDGEQVLIVGSDGRGTIRLMDGFSANKAPGSGGKIAFKSDKVIGAMAVSPESDVFILSRLGKIIRFKAGEIPPKEGVVQGVNCMALRSDECVTMVVT